MLQVSLIKIVLPLVDFCVTCYLTCMVCLLYNYGKLSINSCDAYKYIFPCQTE